jgi:flagellar hook-basal body complex protein FliE
MTIDPSFAVSGPEWRIDGVGRVDAAGPAAGGISESQGFGEMLGKQIAQLQGMQEEASAQAQALATGQTQDTTAVVMAAEKAKLTMQLATQLRDRGVTALQEVLRTQV